MAYELPKFEDIHEVCEICALRKQHRQPFPKGVVWKTQEDARFNLYRRM